MPSNNKVVSTEDYMMRKIREFMLDNICNDEMNSKLASFLQASFDVDVINQDDLDKYIDKEVETSTDFIDLNNAIDLFLPDPRRNDSSDLHAECSEMLRAKFRDKDESIYYSSRTRRKLRGVEKQLVNLLQLGVVRNFEHLKELIQKIN